jgi:hypothetical protein
VRFHADPGDAEAGSPCPRSRQPWAAVPTFNPLSFRRSRFYEGEHLAGALERGKNEGFKETAGQRIQGCASVRAGASERKPEA